MLFHFTLKLLLFQYTHSFMIKIDVRVHPEIKTWLKFAKFEEEHGDPGFYYFLIITILY